MLNVRDQIQNVEERIAFISRLEKLYIITYQDPTLQIMVTALRAYIEHNYNMTGFEEEIPELRKNEPTAGDFLWWYSTKPGITDESLNRLYDYYIKVHNLSCSNRNEYLRPVREHSLGQAHRIEAIIQARNSK